MKQQNKGEGSIIIYLDLDADVEIGTLMYNIRFFSDIKLSIISKEIKLHVVLDCFKT